MIQSSNSPISIDLPGLIGLRHRLVGTLQPPAAKTAAGDGQYRTRFRGRGMEFAEVRAYQPGDDVRSIDWRVTARRGKAHTKLFHEERERPVLVAVDYRTPMFFATRGCFKAVQVSRLAALLAWQALGRGDRIGCSLKSIISKRGRNRARGRCWACCGGWSRTPPGKGRRTGLSNRHNTWRPLCSACIGLPVPAA
jgi:uncharacterized protein (DUF58 family)